MHTRRSVWVKIKVFSDLFGLCAQTKEWFNHFDQTATSYTINLPEGLAELWDGDGDDGDGAVCWALSIMKEDRGSRVFPGGFLTIRPRQLSLIFRLEETTCSRMWARCTVSQTSLLRAENPAGTSSLVVAAGCETTTVSGFTPLSCWLTVCIRAELWHASASVCLRRSLLSVVASYLFGWGVLGFILTGPSVKSTAEIMKSQKMGKISRYKYI